MWKNSGELYFRNGQKWSSTRVTLSATPKWEPPRKAFDVQFIDTRGTSYDVTSDGKRIIVVRRTHAEERMRIELVSNWFALMDSAR